MEVSPAVRPAARSTVASIRTVVDLPLVPVTSTTGTRPWAVQSTSSGAGSAVIGQVRRVGAESDRDLVVVPQERHVAVRRLVLEVEQTRVRLLGDGRDQLYHDR